MNRTADTLVAARKTLAGIDPRRLEARIAGIETPLRSTPTDSSGGGGGGGTSDPTGTAAARGTRKSFERIRFEHAARLIADAAAILTDLDAVLAGDNPHNHPCFVCGRTRPPLSAAGECFLCVDAWRGVAKRNPGADRDAWRRQRATKARQDKAGGELVRRNRERRVAGLPEIAERTITPDTTVDPAAYRRRRSGGAA